MEGRSRSHFENARYVRQGLVRELTLRGQGKQLVLLALRPSTNVSPKHQVRVSSIRFCDAIFLLSKTTQKAKNQLSTLAKTSYFLSDHIHLHQSQTK